MKRQSVLAWLVVIGVVAPPARAAQQRSAGGTHATAPHPSAPATSSPARSTSAGRHGSRDHARTRPQPTVPPFPNIATLSGPLPQGLNPPFVNNTRDLFRVGHGSRSRSSLFFPGIAYGGALPETTAPSASAAAAPAEAAAPTGMLRLTVTPGSSQVFVDGAYVGTADDVEGRRGLVLPAGPHRIEFRARGYTTESLDIDVPAHDFVTYRASLDPARPVVAPARGSATMYVIPGCYLGNVPPRPERVQAGCDVSKVRVLPPQPIAHDSGAR